MKVDPSVSVCVTQPGFAHYRNDLFTELARIYDSFWVVYTTNQATYPGEIAPRGFDSVFTEGPTILRWFMLFLHLVEYRPDIVLSSRAGYAESVISRIYCLLFRKRHVVWVLEWRSPEKSGNLVRRTLRRARAFIGKVMIKSAHAVLAMGTQAERYVLAKGASKEATFTTINCSEDVGAGIVRARSAPVSQPLTILFLGRLLDWKGLDILISAFARLERENNVQLLVAGDGPFRTFCEELADELGIQNITFAGSVDPVERWQYLSKADVFVLPSCVRENSYEAWGLVINEAMSASLPVVSTDAVGAAYDLIHPGRNGFVAQNGDADSLYEALKKTLDSDIHAMGIYSRRIFDEKNRYPDVARKFSDAISHATNSV